MHAPVTALKPSLKGYHLRCGTECKSYKMMVGGQERRENWCPVLRIRRSWSGDIINNGNMVLKAWCV